VLTARKGCNKIIHADTVSWRWKLRVKHPFAQRQINAAFGSFDTPCTYPYLLLRGTLHTRPWTAELSLFAWMHALSTTPFDEK
jgi:hypothetical protein